jgi:hypothetical protein
MAQFPKITVHSIEYSFTVGWTDYKIFYNATDKLVQVFRREQGVPGMVKIFQDGTPVISLEIAMTVLKCCLSILKIEKKPL